MNEELRSLKIMTPEELLETVGRCSSVDAEQANQAMSDILENYKNISRRDEIKDEMLSTKDSMLSKMALRNAFQVTAEPEKTEEEILQEEVSRIKRKAEEITI